MSLQRAREAAARGGWEEAYDLLMEADANGLAEPGDLPLLGEVAYAAGELDVTIDAWERTHADVVLVAHVPGRAPRAARAARAEGGTIFAATCAADAQRPSVQVLLAAVRAAAANLGWPVDPGFRPPAPGRPGPQRRS